MSSQDSNGSSPQDLKTLIQEINKTEQEIKKGGGEKRIKKQHNKGKLTARERIDMLIDDDTNLYELGLWAGYEMYEDEGGCPSGGVVTGIGTVSGRDCVIVANDATVKAGAWFPITAKKNLRAQEIALENKLPILYLVDSAGVYLPMQDQFFPTKIISVEYSEIMLDLVLKGSHRLQQ